MKTKLRSVKFIVVDEICMVSSLTLTYMHLRLEKLFGGDDSGLAVGVCLLEIYFNYNQ